MIQKLLIANRGEIACRIMRTCREMGIATVAVFAEPDASARHVREADEALQLSGDTPVAAYLNIPAILDAARRTGADAIHPGYGFLAENADFAAACRDADMTFVGPAPDVIARMGSKREARRLVSAAGVPVVPGYDGAEQDDERLLAEVTRIGFPVMVKASAGGGGRGMRLVTQERDAVAAIASARREALAAFGDGTLLLELAIEHPRHIEFQIFGDQRGSIVHLGERECSIQRRHQKIIEETPAPGLSDSLRAQMAEAALTVGRLLNYTNAGTVEFILAPDGAFYFLEVNTRLQVEHPVTELVTRLNLVRWQIEVAEGKPLPLTQEQITFTGHAIEARLCAENPAHDFQPATGHILRWREPDSVRIDAGIREGDTITPHFDSLLAKICAHAATRHEAARSLARAVNHTVALGVQTNAALLSAILRHRAFLAGETNTDFISAHAGELFVAPNLPYDSGASPEYAALFATVANLNANTKSNQLAYPAPANWRNNPSRPYIERLTFGDGDDPATVALTPTGPMRFDATYTSLARQWQGSLLITAISDQQITANINGHELRAWVAADGAGVTWVAVAGQTWSFTPIDPLAPRTGAQHTTGSLLASMPGVVRSVVVVVGQQVQLGEALMTLEAMKMEQTIRAPHAGVVATIHYAPGEQVTAGATLLSLHVEESDQRT